MSSLFVGFSSGNKPQWMKPIANFALKIAVSGNIIIFLQGLGSTVTVEPTPFIDEKINRYNFLECRLAMRKNKMVSSFGTNGRF